jgi:two-component system, cell cycle sensor histidine kinase PleC
VAITGITAEQRRTRMGGAIRTARELIHQLTEQSAQLEEARKHAEAASEAKTQFLATMSHELRTL